MYLAGLLPLLLVLFLTINSHYYLKLCNEVKKSIVTNKQSFVLNIYLDAEEIDLLSCFLTSYFEDLISETNIWNTFVNIHKRQYNKYLPFYEMDEYYPDEINLQDVVFLIWYFLNTMQNEKFIGPVNDFIFEIAEKVMDVFEDAWEFAPENEHLKTYYFIDTKETDFYLARNLVDGILFKTYLFYPDTLLDLRDSERELVEETEREEHLLNFLNENRDQLMHKTHTRLLGLKGKEWVAEILGNNHPLHNDYLNMSQKIRGYFLYKGQDTDNVFLEHIASSKRFNLTKKSFDHSDSLTEIDTILFMGIVKWRNEWWFSGIFFQSDFNPDLILDEKNSMKSRMEVNFIDHQENDLQEMLDNQLKAFKEFNNGSQIAFMESDEIDSFVKGYVEYSNAYLNLSEKEKEEAKQRAREDGFFGKEKEAKDFTKVSESALVFFNPKSGVEIGLAVNSAFPSTDNLFFNEEESEDHLLRLFMNEELSAELAMYCIENYGQDLPFLKSGEGNLYIENIDFLLRFWKVGNYYSKPSITFTGKKE